jgi:hypothetical protein
MEVGRRKSEEGRRKKEEGRRKKEEGRRKKEEVIIAMVSVIENVLGRRHGCYKIADTDRGNFMASSSSVMNYTK